MQPAVGEVLYTSSVAFTVAFRTVAFPTVPQGAVGYYYYYYYYYFYCCHYYYAYCRIQSSIPPP